IGAVRDKDRLPLAFPEAKKLCYGYLEPVGTKEHFDWWRYTFHDRLKSEYDRMWKGSSVLDLQRFEEKVYKFQCGTRGD
ncbi:MAG: hypothetical protein ACREBU_13430, partial [Nitrososphaera sp.]